MASSRPSAFVPLASPFIREMKPDDGVSLRTECLHVFLHLRFPRSPSRSESEDLQNMRFFPCPCHRTTLCVFFFPVELTFHLKCQNTAHTRPAPSRGEGVALEGLPDGVWCRSDHELRKLLGQMVSPDPRIMPFREPR